MRNSDDNPAHGSKPKRPNPNPDKTKWPESDGVDRFFKVVDRDFAPLMESLRVRANRRRRAARRSCSPLV